MLYGRDAERAQIAGLLDGARRSRSGALVVRGEPGVGKSALLLDTRERAADMHVLAARGVESEADLPYAALHQLFRSSLGLAERLPAPQADALTVALGIAEGAMPERFLVSAACLSLLSELAERRPVLCLVDDAHWLDAASADALLFVARRLDAEGVVMLFGAREGDVQSFDARDVPSLVLTGLDEAASASLLARAVDAQVSPGVVERLVAQSGGNALALLELPSALTAGQLSGREPLPETLPLTQQVESIFLERVRRLREETQQLLLVAAADETGDLALVLRAAKTFGAGIDALNAAEQARLVTAHGTHIDFRHPLVRSALYAAATSSERRAAHRALADALGDEESERRTWHLASTVLEHDEGIAELVERVAKRAEARGAHGSAARALQRAAEISEDPAARIRRLVGAARAASTAGWDDDAVAIANSVLALVDDPLGRADLAGVLGLAELRRGRPAEAVPILIDGARDVADADPRKAIRLLARASSFVLQGRNAAMQLELASLVFSIAPPSGDGQSAFIINLLAAMAAHAEGDPAEAKKRMERAMAWGSSSDDTLDVFLAGLAAAWLGDDRRVDPIIARVISLARERGEIGTLSEALSFAAAQLIRTQRYDDAAVAAGEAYQLARELGAENYTAIPLNVLAVVAAVRGEEDDAERGGNAVLALATAHGLPLRAGAAQFTLGLLEMGRGRWQEALDRFDGAVRDVRDEPLIATWVAPFRIEAAVRLDRREHAVRVLDEFAAWTEHTGSPWARPLVASSRALLATGDEATAHFDEALILAEDARPLDLARIHLLYGEHLRRERRRADARVHLRAALEGFERLRAAPWIERAAAELRATGEKTRRRDPSTFDELTPKEVQIARLVGEGLSNKEVAAQLFLSPRTIDYHLRHVFTKLGLTSRTQLARLSFDAAPLPAPAAAPASS